MHERKTEVINLRMTPEIKRLLRRAADHDHRTLSNMLEVLILDYCRTHELLGANEALLPRESSAIANPDLRVAADFKSGVPVKRGGGNTRKTSQPVVVT